MTDEGRAAGGEAQDGHGVVLGETQRQESPPCHLDLLHQLVVGEADPLRGPAGLVLDGTHLRVRGTSVLERGIYYYSPVLDLCCHY